MIKLNCHPYSCTVWLTDDLAAFNARVLRDMGPGLSPTQEGTLGTTAQDCGGKHSVVGVFDGSRGTLVHELAHAAFNVMQYIGQPVDADHSEAFCYLQTSFYEQAVKWLDKKEAR